MSRRTWCQSLAVDTAIRGIYGVARAIHPERGDTVQVVSQLILPSYFETLEAGIVAGRSILDGDLGAGFGPRNVVVSARFELQDSASWSARVRIDGDVIGGPTAAAAAAATVIEVDTGFLDFDISSRVTRVAGPRTAHDLCSGPHGSIADHRITSAHRAGRHLRGSRAENKGEEAFQRPTPDARGTDMSLDKRFLKDPVGTRAPG